MKATQGQRIKTGIFTVIGLCMLIVAIFLIGRTKNMFGNTFHVYGTFKNVGGLEPGNNVRFVGINVGTITNIQIISDTLARVDMIIDEKAHAYIKEDAVATIGSDGLMGDKLVSIASVSPNAKCIKDGARIASVDPADFGAIIGKVQRIAANAETITDGLAGIANQISSGKGNIGRLIYDNSIAKNLDATMTNMKTGTAGFSENMQAAKHNFLLKGYFKKKERKKQEAADQAQEAAGQQPSGDQKPDTKADKKAKRKANKEAKKDQSSNGQ